MIGQKYIYEFAHSVNKLLHSEVKDAINILNKIERMSNEQFHEYRLSVLNSLVTNAYENIPYYKRIFNEYGVLPNSFKSYSDLQKLPVLTKEIIRNNEKELISINSNKYKFSSRRSGGTTGEPIKILVDKQTQALETYSFLRGLQMMGWTPDLKKIRLFGGSLGGKNNISLKEQLRSFAMNDLMLSAFDLNADTINEYIKKIQNSGPSVLLGYASSLYNLALLKREKGYKVNNVKHVISTSELMEDEWLDVIAEEFNCEVKCYYGCSEVESLGYQISQRGPYYVPSEVNYIENPSFKDIEENGLYENSLLITSLHNKVFPLIRYVNGDLGKVISNPNNNNSILIESLVGRSDDMFITPTGNKITGRLGAKIISSTGLRVDKFQFIQNFPDTIEFRYQVRGEDLSENEKDIIRNSINHVFQSEVKIVFLQTQEFLLTKNGKFRIVINNIPKVKI